MLVFIRIYTELIIFQIFSPPVTAIAVPAPSTEGAFRSAATALLSYNFSFNFHFPLYFISLKWYNVPNYF